MFTWIVFSIHNLNTSDAVEISSSLVLISAKSGISSSDIFPSLLPEFVKNHWDFERNKGIIEPNGVLRYTKKIAFFIGIEEPKTICSQVQNYIRREDRKKKEK